MPARVLTDAEVRGLRAEGDQRLVIYDAKARGLCLRVTAHTKSWSFLYRPRGSPQQRRYTIGTYPAWSLSAARDMALTLRRQVEDGGDPVVEAKTRREALTVVSMIERFLDRAKHRLRSWRIYEHLLNRDIVPTIGARRAGDVTRAEVANVLDKVAARAPVVANRLQNTLSSVYSWAVSEGLVESNPVRGLRKRHQVVVRDRVLSDDEIRRFWQATGNLPPIYRDALRLILLTAQRPGEVAGMTAEEVDSEAGLWRIPPARTKNKRLHIVPLVGEASAIVGRALEHSSAGVLIRTRRRGSAPTNQDIAKAFERLRAGGIFDGEKPRTHDLRRTAATLMGRLEIDRMTVAYVLNHATITKATVTGSTYDQHDYVPQKRRALESLDQEVRRIVSGETVQPNLVTIARA